MKRLLIIGLAISGLVISGFALTSCNVTRTITTRSETYQHGDSSIVIQSRTVESYDATKKVNIY